MIQPLSVINIISDYQPELLPLTPQSAAVMVILLSTPGDQLEIVLTKRAADLPTYAGDYSFPGGMHETVDADLYSTAVRELQEELGISAGAYERIGQLNDFTDRFGNVVRPFVAFMSKTDFFAMLTESKDEIAEIYYFPLADLPAFKDDPALHAITRRRPSYSYVKENVHVWGLTAAILVHFWNIIAGTS